MRVFLTGTAGFIGDPFARHLRDADHAVAGLARLRDDDDVALARARARHAGGAPGAIAALRRPVGRHRLFASNGLFASTGPAQGGPAPGRSRETASVVRPRTRDAAAGGA
ncbi:hypothetical protein ASG51_13550 [Methylobacterium sp. Leaf465]|uniref:NAD(P)-dependent oxidoreductase n=1 Tax=Methylobacterium sp. Leaf465 TaxID=1736385 RepID=UPI000701B94A|nr:NAD(P)-dependent oxidoreductase [Methylobacterium sp. Leaf465]KQT70496.1 hypothetical protein ASG51_13550 [Methylobacterium sp. Leaf465]